MKRILHFVFTFLICSIIFQACKKDNSVNNNPLSVIGNFSVQVTSRTQTQASISWTKPSVPAGSVLQYKVYLTSVQVAQNITDTFYNFSNLIAAQSYNGNVVAYVSATDSVVVPFFINSRTPGQYDHLAGYYKVTETEYDINNITDTNSLVFTGRIEISNDTNLLFFQNMRVPSTYWSTNYSATARPFWGDSLYGGFTSVSGQILSQNSIRIQYLYGYSITVFKVQQIWQKLQNPAVDSLPYAFVWPTEGPGLIKTYAGSHISNGPTFHSGDGGSALNAILGIPTSIHIDNNNQGYISEGGSSLGAVRKVNTAGNIDIFAGNYTAGFSGDGGLAINAQLGMPSGITSDGNGNVFISDVTNRVIRKVNSAGIISTYAGIPGQGGFSGDGGPATSAKIVAAANMFTDGSGNLLFPDVGNHALRKINSSGIISTIAGYGVAGFSGDGGPAALAQFKSPNGVAADHLGNLYVADKENNVIRKINTSGIISTFAGTPGFLGDGFSGDGGPATAAKMSGPTDVAVDQAGNVYVSDYGNNRIRKISTAGIISTIAGNGSSNSWDISPAFYNGDWGLATKSTIPWPKSVFCKGNILYVVDGNHRVRKIFL